MGRGLSEQEQRILRSAFKRKGSIEPWRAQQVVASVAGVRSRASYFNFRDHHRRRASGQVAIDATSERQNAIKSSASRALRRLVKRGLLERHPSSWRTFEFGSEGNHRFFTPARYKITELGRQTARARSEKERTTLTDRHREVSKNLVCNCNRTEKSELTSSPSVALRKEMDSNAVLLMPGGKDTPEHLTLECNPTSNSPMSNPALG
jgi:hypothetical protein